MNNINGKVTSGDPGWIADFQQNQCVRSKWDRKLVHSVIGVFLVVCPTFEVGSASGFMGELHAADATRLVTAEARRQGVPVTFALKVAKIESGVQCGRVGRHGERGPVQILPRTAAGLGYRNIAKASCATQTAAGVRHLAICYRGAKGNTYRAAACHNGGLGMLKRSRFPRSVTVYARKAVR